ncbi:MAG TPA: helix-turn-helix transcriptional regulator [Ktedonobacteraceae bacterium]|nr:helix-turn-helix transcriptional regulator [Ktedonobacteraceae bacterium]
MKPHMSKPNVLLVQARLDLGLSQCDVANRLNISLQAVWRWENGVTQPYPRHRRLLCTLFQKTAEELGLNPICMESSQPAPPDTSVKAQFQVFLENCQYHPIYQYEYQAFIKRSLRFNHPHQCAVSFADWFIAAHPEQAIILDNQNESNFHQPA